MNTNDLHNWDHQHLWHPFTPMRLWLDEEPLIIARGQGPYLYDTDDNRYLDGVSSLWCNIHGHNHPHINAAIRRQLGQVAHSTLLGLACETSVLLAKKLAEITPALLSRVFYSDSGATAVEIALKIAFQYWLNRGKKDRNLFLALKQSYHGDTLGSVSVGGIEIFHQIFGPLTFHACFSPSPHPYRFEGTPDQCSDHCLQQMESILKQNSSRVAAVLIEPLVQGAAGIIVHPPGFLRSVRKLTEKYDVLLIADEVATGFGRTGTMFACQQENVCPDIMSLAKGITGGYLPLAATLVTGRIFEPFLSEPYLKTTFYHGHTYTGNALGCAAALANLEIFERENTLAHLPAKISLIKKHLQKIAEYDLVGDVRQCGMMAAIELVEEKKTRKSFDPNRRLGAWLCRTLRSQGLILRPLQDVIIIMPPLSINLSQLETLLNITAAGIKNLTAHI